MIRSDASDYEIYSEIGTFMVAGQDSVSTAMQMLIMHLCANSGQQEKCRAEVDQILESKYMDDKTGMFEDLTMEDLGNLKHLDRCIQETLRITHVLPLSSRHVEAPLKLTETLTIPKDSMVLVGIWALHRNPKYFPEPDKFDPDRFLPENVKKRHPFSFVPFAGGPRNCIGIERLIFIFLS